MAIKHSTAELIGTFLEMLGFGIYLAVGPQAFLAVRRKRLRKGLTMYLYSTIIVTFILIISHLVINIFRVFIAFTAHTNIPNAPEAFYTNLNTTSTFLKNLTVIVTTLVADILIIYRTFVVWGCQWWVLILPAILYCLDVATSILCLWFPMKAKDDHENLDTATVARSTYFFAATLGVNLVCTCMIAYRIWTVQNAVAKYMNVHHRIRNALSIMLESAAIYTADLVCMIILASIHNTSLFIFLNSMPPVIGLVFTFVILRSSDRCNSDEINSESRSNDMNTERIDFKPSDPNSEGVSIHLETIIHHDTEHD